MTTVQEELYRFLLQWLQSSALQSSAWSGPGLAGARTAETTATVIGWAIFGAGVQWARGNRGRSAEEIAGQVAKALVSGLTGIFAAPSANRLVPEGGSDPRRQALGFA